MILLTLVLFTTSTYAVFDAYHAKTAYESGDVAAARAHYQQMVVDNFNDWQALYNLGTIALNEKEYDEAVHDFEKVVALQPDNREARERLEIARKLRDQQQQEEQKKQEEDKKNDEEKEQEQQDQQQDQDQNEQQQDKQKQDKQQQKNTNEQNKKQEEQERAQKEQEQKEQKTSAREQEEKKQEEKRQQQKAAERKKQDERFSKREQHVLQQLDALDQRVQKEMVRYAVSQAEQGAEQYGGRKTW